MSLVYFDYNATHPPFQNILDRSLKNYSENFYNPSGPTRYSLSKQALIETARSYFSNITKKEKDKIVFSSTGTEANLFLLNCIKEIHNEVIVSPFEHSSIYENLHSLKIPFRLIKTNKSGLIDLNDLETKFTEKKAPLILIYAANETGVIQPIYEAKKILNEFPIYSDLMQAYGKIPIDFDLLSGFSFSGHKIGAGFGASLTYFENLENEFGILKGGNQENGHRAGTENSMAIESFMETSKIQLENLNTKNEKLIQFRNLIESEFKKLNIKIISENSQRLQSTIFMILPIEEIDFFMLGMEERGVLVSNGSSCKSRTREASKNLLNMGYSNEEALRAIRISMGYFTTKEEVDKLILTTSEVINLLK